MNVYLEAVNVQQVEFSFVRLLQDAVLLNCHQMLLQVTFNFIKASETVQFIKEMRNNAKNVRSLMQCANIAPHLYFSRSLSTTDRTTGFLSTESSNGESTFVRICRLTGKKKKKG